jgi:serine/threonine-protein kinase
VQVGDIVADKYRVEQLLAAGGMGLVVAARHETLGQAVAIKFLLGEGDIESKAERFLREARAAARIESPRVCRVFDVGTLPSGVPFMVMEHITGHDLAQELKARGPMPVAEAVDVMLQALEGLAEAHSVGIVHRDLKPSNLFLSIKPGRPREMKILDFGISKLAPNALAEDTEEDLTGTAAMLGSPRYMSPEQIKSAKHVDARTDIWSMGVILYQLLDGKSPFSGTTMGETISKVLLHEPPPITSLRADVPPGLAQIIGRCLQRNRDQRYSNVAELALALGPFGTSAATSSVHRITALLVDGQLGAATSSAALPEPAAPAIAFEPAEQAPAHVDSHPSIGTVSPLTHPNTGSPVPQSRKWLWLGLAAVLATLIVATALVLRPPGTVDGTPSAAAAPGATAVAVGSAVAEQKSASVGPAQSASAAPTASAAASASGDSVPAASADAPPSPKTRTKVWPKTKSVDDLLSESY